MCSSRHFCVSPEELAAYESIERRQNEVKDTRKTKRSDNRVNKRELRILATKKLAYDDVKQVVGSKCCAKQCLG